MAARQQLSIDLDAEVGASLRAHAAETHLSEGEIIDRAIRAYDLRSLLAQIRERSDLDENQALALRARRTQSGPRRARHSRPMLRVVADLVPAALASGAVRRTR
jgi:hypothetical protein